jgi:ketosteroid isomerase-like protein
MTKQRVSLKTLFLFIALLGLAGILPAKSPESKLSSTDRARLEQMIADYRTGWLTGDRQKILDLFADDATIIPSGLRPIIGKAAMIKFWWPQDGSTTSILHYDIHVLKIDGDNRNAFMLENGKLSWTYKKDAVSFSKNQESYEVTLFRKDPRDQWHIIERIWTDVKP